MKLKIENIGMIENADIELKGLTLIAGNNNTGKSTIGKILYTFFKAAQNLNERVAKTKFNKIKDTLRQVFIHQFTAYDDIDYLQIFYGNDNDLDSITKNIFTYYNNNRNIDENEFKKLLSFHIYDSKKEHNLSEFIKYDESFIDHITSLYNVDVQSIQKKIFDKYFNKVFCNQINSHAIARSEGKIKTTIKEIESSLVFIDNQCAKVDLKTSVFNNALFIDNPLIVDRLNNELHVCKKDFFLNYADDDLYSDELLDLLNIPEKDQDILTQILNEDRVAKILRQIALVIPENLHRDQSLGNKLFVTKTIEDRQVSIDIRNISTGLKSFALLKLLILNGAIKDRDCLILDEPEIHLHPSWQLIYAELIVLLQKEFNLTIVVNTHSHYFVDALDLYSRKHETADNFNCYLTKINDYGFAEFEDVTLNLKYVYRQMSAPFPELNGLRCRYKINK